MPKLPATILGTAHLLPERRYETADILARTARTDDVADVIGRTGIVSRGWFEPGTRAGVIGARVVRDALAQAGLEPGDLRRLIFVSSTGGDALIPATVNAVLDQLGVRDTCDGFDLNNSCLGLLTAFDLAARTVATGLHPVAVVSVEIQSPFLGPDDPRPWLVLADAAACVVLGRPDSGAGVVASHLANDGSLRGSVSMVHPGLSGEPARIRFTDTHRRMTTEAVDFLTTSARRVVDEAGIPLDAVDWFLPHQPNGSMLARAVEALAQSRAHNQLCSGPGEVELRLEERGCVVGGWHLWPC